jgi:hypothetical protein
MNILIMTVNREKLGSTNYIHQTIESFEKNFKQKSLIKLVVGSPDTEYLEPYKKKYVLYPVNNQKWQMISDWSVVRRAKYNYYRCLTLFKGNLLILEDDIIFTDNCYEKLIKTIREIEEAGLKKYFLSLYSPFELTTFAGKNYGLRNPDYFFGTQGIYFPGSILKEFTSWIEKFDLLYSELPYDGLIKTYATNNKIPVIDCRYSLVQHTAPKDSTGLSLYLHQSPTFKPE